MVKKYKLIGWFAATRSIARREPLLLTKEISEHLRLRIDELHEARTSYKNISKSLGVYQSMLRQMIYKCKKGLMKVIYVYFSSRAL